MPTVSKHSPNESISETELIDRSLDSRCSSPPSELESWFSALLEKAGVTLNGPQPWDIQVHNAALYTRALKRGSLGLGEAYVDGWWDCQQIEEFIRRIIIAKLDQQISGKWVVTKHWLLATLFNRQSEKRAFQVGEQHYDVGNSLYEAMLDPTMAYSCAYWKDTNTLHQAQLNKLRLVCDKAQLNEGESVLEIGCGWGSFAQLAAKEYGVKLTGITISVEQQKLAQKRCQGLPVDILLEDYRQLQGMYDKLVSIGMFEHVGPKNYDTYFKHAHRLMKDDGIFVLHTIGSDISQGGTDPWIDKYIFPNGVIPSLTQISDSVEPYFVVEDVHNFGTDYAKTLMAWNENFNRTWPRLQYQYSERFYRMWTYYLRLCAGAFQSRSLQLYQIVLRKRLIPTNPYQSIR
ncbi:cyclopropane fatty acyl phospholipid synthase [Marinomonas mediterranea]|jgi:cyclopropane-fatty-acyl-phospholipid synthase (EC 2.1.1.79)|uniref:Cyclopropane-fatty-acyl-phospholipid synthase n=1 Tax=Marinomonas mediterranea (strain ATCC 700492 / JCM 21426 / NBRC 103028 / MMB-1) TaxID=717774 RepID=F2JVK0_MARM1|nr:cyclopropane fatty acyl phospholipid synthase [Marinomonas mediterranea]ADZ90544.1 Cyclopropane-fatty-acyl-phospholipid synthase [Marinomonas mediterranea MMB-1]WCN08593.1 cyclopropane fatty acyl phospholipid synthase [Marinomonas mediterranea]WCN12647.1 cyclopropane fatty acyl phospholipid synthase [Marinomonas mediterranea]WCN16721.1 cyclopropane fatty acyl phospholipid synthase [Marinomonas mediterranea MMB-1]